MVTFLLDRRDVVSAFLKDRGQAAVVCGLGSSTWDVAAVDPNYRNFYSWGAMGGAVSMGLGLALAQPDMRVIVITGDGEAMMGVGSFATVAAKRPANLSILVLDNEHYGETGMQPAHTGAGADIAMMARGAGVADATTIRTDSELAAAVDSFHSGVGLRLIVAKIDPASPPRVMPTRDAVENKLTFRRAILGG